MCGICGLLDLSDRSKLDLHQAVTKMSNRLEHRGPDAHGVWCDHGVALGHRRLSIIDLAGSIQPMTDPSKRFVLVFNGEIYNYIELRSELMKRGFQFVTDGDTEVLLSAYIHYGAECLHHLNGMFSFALWDRETKTLFAARDRMGVKPFFYGLSNDGLFAFASELQGLRGLPLNFSLQPSALHQYLCHGFIRSPDTIFEGVQELQPAHYLFYSGDNISIKRYWELPSIRPELSERSTDDLAGELRDLIRSAVHLRLRSDVPLGAFLSGGLDSSVVVAGMKDLGETAIHTFTVGFDGKGFDESPFAREVSKHLATEHSETRVAPDAERLLFSLVRHYGQPFGDSSAIPTWHLCKETRRKVTVALSGDGGDELFCGYRRYVGRRMLDWYRILPTPIRHGFLSRIIEALPEGTAYYDDSFIKKLKLFNAMDSRLSGNPEDVYSAFFKGEDARFLLGLSSSDIPSCQNTHEACDRKGLPEVEKIMRNDILHYLPDDILTKVDRASMAHGLEVRSPFLDYRVVEFAARLPLHHKLHGLTTKYILRKAFAKDIPPEPLRRSKHGFAVPLGDGFHGALRKAYEEVVISADHVHLVDRRVAERLLSEHLQGRIDHGHKLWLLLFLSTWQMWWDSGQS